MADASSAPTVTVRLELQPFSEPLTGRIWTGGAARDGDEFIGWTQLARAIREITEPFREADNGDWLNGGDGDA